MDNYYFHMDNLSVGYDKKALIHDICIGIKKGEIVTLIGPNGSGKSTILKSITRQLQIIGGKVYFDDRNLNSFSYKELSTRMAVVLTERMRPELMTCHDIVATGRYPYTGRLGILSREDEEKVEEAMRAVHAESLGSRDFNNISDGQRQRVLLARAICQEPDIIILDEPTSSLDVSIQAKIINMLIKLKKEQNLTYMFITHDMGVMRNVSNRVAIMYLGKICEIAPTETFYRNPLHPYTQMLLSSIPVVSEEDETIKPKAVECVGEIPSPVNVPTGCSFHTRCPYKCERCTKEDPVMREVEPGHTVRCHLIDK